MRWARSPVAPNSNRVSALEFIRTLPSPLTIAPCCAATAGASCQSRSHFGSANFASLELCVAEHGHEADVGGVAANPDLYRLGGIGHPGGVDQLPFAPAPHVRIGQEYLGDRVKIGRFDARGIAADIARRNRRGARKSDHDMGIVAADPAALDEAVERGGAGGADWLVAEVARDPVAHRRDPRAAVNPAELG